MEKKPLHDILCDVLGSPFPDGGSHCYFEAPSDDEMKYPCIKYNYADNLDDYADNSRYISFKRYVVTLIDEDPDSKIQERLISLPYCKLDRIFAKNGLSHFVYILYYNGPRIKEVNNNEVEMG